MEEYLYPASVLLMAIIAFVMYQNHNMKIAALALFVGVYIIYSNETGHTATDFKNEMVESAAESADDFAKDFNVESFNAKKKEEAVK